MLLPNMNVTGIVRHASADLPVLGRKFAAAKQALARRHTKGDREQVLKEIHAYRSPARADRSVVLRYCKAGIRTANSAWYRGGDERMRAARVREDGLTAFHYAYHVCEQYGGRSGPDVSADERLRRSFLDHYMSACHVVDPMVMEPEVITSVDQGWIFGKMDNDEDLVHLITFVDQGQFFKDRHALEGRLGPSATWAASAPAGGPRCCAS